MESQEDTPFRHYSARQRLTAWISMHLFDHLTYTVRHGLLKGMKRKGGLGWLPPVVSHGTVTPEEQFWSSVDLRGMTVYDVGAFHGLLTLLFASRANAVVCFEPNSRNRARLLENLRLNRVENVTVRACGAGSQREIVKMAANPLAPGGASVDRKAVDELSRSGVKTFVEDVSIIALDEEIAEAGLPVPDFIKIDIEGWEIEALRGARQLLASRGPALFLEMHGETLREKRRKTAEIVEFLWDLDYRNIVHVETRTAITPENPALAMRGHLYCRKT